MTKEEQSAIQEKSFNEMIIIGNDSSTLTYLWLA